MTQLFPFSIEIPNEFRRQIKSELQNLPQLPYGSINLPQYLLLSGLIRKLVSQAANLPPILFGDTLRVDLLGLLPELGSGEMTTYFSVKYLHVADDGSEDICLKLEIDAGFTELGLTAFDRRSLRPQYLTEGPNGELVGALAIDVRPIAKEAPVPTVPINELSATRHWDGQQGRWVADVVQFPSFLDSPLPPWNPNRQNSGRSEHVSLPRQARGLEIADLSPSGADLRMVELFNELPRPRSFNFEHMDPLSELVAVYETMQARLADRAREQVDRPGSDSPSTRPFESARGVSLRDLEISLFRGFFEQQALESEFQPDPNYGVPAACIGCTDYHGITYRGNKLICGIHPHGVAEGATCADYSTKAISS